MSRDVEPLLASLPAISDKSVVEILNLLQAFVVGFESFYGDQIRRYYDERSHANRIQPKPTAPLDDPPF